MTIETWQRALLGPEVTLQQAIANLDDTALQIVLVVAPDGRLLGTVTDGDIRRGLLRGIGLSDLVSSIMQVDPVTVSTQMARDSVLHLMQSRKIHQLPIVDSDHRVLGLHVWSEIAPHVQRPNTMVLMAGGFGTRLRPHTDTCPKPMLRVGDKPMLEHIIESARDEGINSFVIAVHYLGHVIEDYFGDGKNWQVTISYIREQTPLGTAGALGLLDTPPTLPVVVANGDVMSQVRFADVLDYHLEHGAAATMAVQLYEWQHPFGVVRTHGVDIVALEEKPITRSHINAGIYVVNPEALASITKGERCDMPDLFRRAQANGLRTIVYPMHENWADIGRVGDLDRVQRQHAVQRDGEKRPE